MQEKVNIISVFLRTGKISDANYKKYGANIFVKQKDYLAYAVDLVYNAYIIRHYTNLDKEIIQYYLHVHTADIVLALLKADNKIYSIVKIAYFYCVCMENELEYADRFYTVLDAIKQSDAEDKLKWASVFIAGRKYKQNSYTKMRLDLIYEAMYGVPCRNMTSVLDMLPYLDIGFISVPNVLKLLSREKLDRMYPGVVDRHYSVNVPTKVFCVKDADEYICALNFAEITSYIEMYYGGSEDNIMYYEAMLHPGKYKLNTLKQILTFRVSPDSLKLIYQYKRIYPLPSIEPGYLYDIYLPKYMSVVLLQKWNIPSPKRRPEGDVMIVTEDPYSPVATK